MDDLEEIRGSGGEMRRLIRYTPFWGLDATALALPRWEVVCFLSPTCDGRCLHCWSANTFLGVPLPSDWHESFWKDVEPTRLTAVRLSGGEPLLHLELRKILTVIRVALGPDVPIQILTSARSLVSLNDGDTGIEKTAEAIQAAGLVLENVEIQMSADEFHAAPLYGQVMRRAGEPTAPGRAQTPIDALQQAARNFLAACDLLKRQNPFFGGGRLKVHAATGRLAFHRTRIFGWMDDETWGSRVLFSEGLVKAGRSAGRADAIPLTKDGPMSLFILPGAEFVEDRQSNVAQPYFCPEKDKTIYLDKGERTGKGAALAGWWNLVNRVFCGGSAHDALRMIGKSA